MNEARVHSHDKIKHGQMCAPTEMPWLLEPLQLRPLLWGANILPILPPYAQNIGRRQSRYSNTYWVPLFNLVLGHNSPRIGMYLLFVSFWNTYWELGYEPDIETPIQTPFQTSDILLVLKHLSGTPI